MHCTSIFALGNSLFCLRQQGIDLIYYIFRACGAENINTFFSHFCRLFTGFIEIYSVSYKIFFLPPRIFAARRCGKAAGMLCAFQGFAAPPGGKKTGDMVEILCETEYIRRVENKDKQRIVVIYWGVFGNWAMLTIIVHALAMSAAVLPLRFRTGNHLGRM